MSALARHTGVERAMRRHFGFDCGEALEIEPGLYAVGEKGTRYECIRAETASNADLLNGIDAGPGLLLLRCHDQPAQ
jgi:hypothetical protein